MAALVSAIHVLLQTESPPLCARAPLRQTRAKEPPFEKIKIWTLSGDLNNPDSSPFAEGRSRGETEREWGAVPAPTIRSRGPGSPWRDASRPITRPRVNVL